MARRCSSLTLAAFTIASAASMQGISPFVSIMPRARIPGSMSVLVVWMSFGCVIALCLPEDRFPVIAQGVEDTDDCGIGRRSVVAYGHAC
jgi:hypothetical protein